MEDEGVGRRVFGRVESGGKAEQEEVGGGVGREVDGGVMVLEDGGVMMREDGGVMMHGVEEEEDDG